MNNPNPNALLAVRFLIENKLKLCKVPDLDVKISEFKASNDIKEDLKVYDLNGKVLSDDDALKKIFGDKTNVDMNSCMIKIENPANVESK